MVAAGPVQVEDGLLLGAVRAGICFEHADKLAVKRPGAGPRQPEAGAGTGGGPGAEGAAGPYPLLR